MWLEISISLRQNFTIFIFSLPIYYVFLGSVGITRASDTSLVVSKSAPTVYGALFVEGLVYYLLWLLLIVTSLDCDFSWFSDSSNLGAMKLS
jgi:hypothetical protein